MVIEWNTHIFSPDLQRFPFHEKASYTPDISVQPVDPLGAYLAQMDQHGVDRAVLVHPEPYGDDHRLVLDCLEQEQEADQRHMPVLSKGSRRASQDGGIGGATTPDYRNAVPRASRQGDVSGQPDQSRSAADLGEGVRSESNHRTAYRTELCTGNGGDVA